MGHQFLPFLIGYDASCDFYSLKTNSIYNVF
jgi:hypothetical protein